VDEVVAQAGCDLGEGVCGAWRDEDNVCPASEFDVEDGVTDGVCPRPLVVVRPDSGAGDLDVCGVEEGEGPFRGDDLDFDVVGGVLVR